MKALLIFAFSAVTAMFLSSPALAENAVPVTVTVQAGQPKNISPDLFGIFFEDLNYAADGDLYAELVQNRSFEYQAMERLDWTPMTAWEQVTRDDARGSLKISDAVPVHPNNPYYIVVETKSSGGGRDCQLRF